MKFGLDSNGPNSDVGINPDRADSVNVPTTRIGLSTTTDKRIPVQMAGDYVKSRFSSLP
jgi:hypothetical protein